MTYEIARDKALKELEGLQPYVVAAKTGLDFDGKVFSFPFFNQSYYLAYPALELRVTGSAALAPLWLQVIVLHYLLQADGTPVADEWITYRQLPGAGIFAAKFQVRAVVPLSQVFGRDLESFKQAGGALGGMPMNRFGDAAFRFLALPHLPMACILYLGDEEVAASANILFDAAAPRYLPTEDLSVLGMSLSGYLQGWRKKYGPVTHLEVL